MLTDGYHGRVSDDFDLDMIGSFVFEARMPVRFQTKHFIMPLQWWALSLTIQLAIMSYIHVTPVVMELKKLMPAIY